MTAPDELGMLERIGRWRQDWATDGFSLLEAAQQAEEIFAALVQPDALQPEGGRGACTRCGRTLADHVPWRGHEWTDKPQARRDDLVERLLSAAIDLMHPCGEERHARHGIIVEAAKHIEFNAYLLRLLDETAKRMGYTLIGESAEIRPAAMSYVKPSEFLALLEAQAGSSAKLREENSLLVAVMRAELEALLRAIKDEGGLPTIDEALEYIAALRQRLDELEVYSRDADSVADRLRQSVGDLEREIEQLRQVGSPEAHVCDRYLYDAGNDTVGCAMCERIALLKENERLHRFTRVNVLCGGCGLRWSYDRAVEGDEKRERALHIERARELRDNPQCAAPVHTGRDTKENNGT